MRYFQVVQEISLNEELCHCERLSTNVRDTLIDQVAVPVKLCGMVNCNELEFAEVVEPTRCHVNLETEWKASNQL